MNKVTLYLSNVGIAFSRIPKALVGLYKYHPNDRYVKNVAVTLDLLGNALTFGDPDETISSRSGKAMIHELTSQPPRWGKGCRLCAFLAVFQEGHCMKAVDRNKGSRAVIPDEITNM